MRALGAHIDEENGALAVSGVGQARPDAVLDCGESGSTLRFLIPVAAALGAGAVFTGHGRLPLRPLTPYLACLPGAGVTCESEGGLPLRISGALHPGAFTLPGDVSSQFVTGLLLALPLLSGDSVIRLLSPLQSRGYVDMTVETMRLFGVQVFREGELTYRVPGGQRYLPQTFPVESDWSQAAFWLAAGALGKTVTLKGLRLDSAQGDRAIVSLLRDFGAQITVSPTGIACSGGKLRGIEIDASQIPDLVPILAVVGAFAEGRTRIYNAARLRIKESDRLRTITEGLQAMGARVTELPDALLLDGGPLRGGKACGAGDHRIVMALSVAAAFCNGESSITGCESIAKSYPDFYEDFTKLGGNAHVIHLG